MTKKEGLFYRGDFPSSPTLSCLSTLPNPFDKSPKGVYKLTIMGSEELQVESSSTPRLQLFLPQSPKAQEPDQPWTVASSPLHTAASVPFRWEEEPGKPRPCTTLVIPTQKCLELPPRLLMDVETAKLSSPTTVLEDSYMGRSRFESSSFSLKRESFRKIWSPGVGKFGSLVLSNRVVQGKGGFGSWRWGKSGAAYKAKCEVVVGNHHVFPTSVDGENDIHIEDDESCKNNGVKKMRKMKRSGSFSISAPVRPHFWATIYEGLKQVVPWKSKKLKRDGLLF